MEPSGLVWGDVDVEPVDSRSELPSMLLDLSSLSLLDLRTVRSPQLDNAVRRTVAEALQGRFGDCVQGQRD